MPKILDITKIPAKILRQKLKPLSQEAILSVKIRDLIDDMRETMVSASGIGLAANQINQNCQLFVIDRALAQENNAPDVFINPEITSRSKDTDIMEEGCLSIPEYFVQIKRPKKIQIKARDLEGNKIKFKVRGFVARVLQHEYDHLNGVLIKDHAQNSK